MSDEFPKYGSKEYKHWLKRKNQELEPFVTVAGFLDTLDDLKFKSSRELGYQDIVDFLIRVV